MTTVGTTALTVARVVPNVTGLDKHFDYLIPESLRAQVAIGSLVRVPLHGRRVAGWVVAIGDADPGFGIERLMPLAKWSSIGPSAELIELAHWAATRWGSDRLRPFLVAASPPTMVAGLPPSRRAVRLGGTAGAGGAGSGVVRIGPLADPLPLVLEAAGTGPALVLHPSAPAARALASRLRREGLTVAVVPDEWAAAAAGVDVVVGSRAAAWAPCPAPAVVVVLDEHDEAYQEERTPTWHARDVLIERAVRAGATCTLVSPCPTATAMRWAGGSVQRTIQASQWPLIEIDDRGEVEPWKRSLVGSSLIRALRDPAKRVVCVLNTVGRARLIACRSCRNLQRCEHCEAAVRQRDDAMFECPRCNTVRPKVCQVCGASAMALVKPGVARLREELHAAANRPVLAVTGESDELPAPEVAAVANVFVGTEAVLHRVRNVDVVAFLDFDAELLAPRYRAGEQAMALLVRAGRLVGARERGGRVIVQTHAPHHEVLQAAVLGDTGRLVDGELARRRLLGLPPFRALAAVDGADAEALALATGLEYAATPKGVLVRADDWLTLGRALAEAAATKGTRTKGSRLRVAVDPPRV
ncbi:MAG: hypothetical protein HY826_02205 [Actinobacteria bacterium]|nr:hypothetical protein [Actinomycetota bacterium]